jgi:hypothetical protein
MRSDDLINHTGGNRRRDKMMTPVSSTHGTYNGIPAGKHLRKSDGGRSLLEIVRNGVLISRETYATVADGLRAFHALDLDAITAPMRMFVLDSPAYIAETVCEYHRGRMIDHFGFHADDFQEVSEGICGFELLDQAVARLNAA